MIIQKFKIPKLPRKLKKKIYGKRGRRNHLCLTLIESKYFKKIFISAINKENIFSWDTHQEKGYQMIYNYKK